MIDQLFRVLKRLAYLLAVAGGIALFYMMMVPVIDILGRSLGLFTINSGVEQTELLMLVVCFFGIALCVSVEGNIVVDVATGHLPTHVNRLIDACWHVVNAAVLALLAYLVIRNGLASHDSGQRTELLGLSPLVGHVIAAIGMTIAVIVALAMAVAVFARGGRAPVEAPVEE